MSTKVINVQFHTDAGFLRRECPACGREFKWFATQGNDPTLSVGNYHCPYCNRVAPSSDWWTRAQLEYAQSEALQQTLGPELNRLEKSFKDLARSSRGFIKVTSNFKAPAKKSPPREPHDMRRVDFTCHPTEPVKVRENWSEPVHCLVCGGMDIVGTSPTDAEQRSDVLELGGKAPGSSDS